MLSAFKIIFDKIGICFKFGNKNIQKQSVKGSSVGPSVSSTNNNGFIQQAGHIINNNIVNNADAKNEDDVAKKIQEFKENLDVFINGLEYGGTFWPRNGESRCPSFSYEDKDGCVSYAQRVQMFRENGNHIIKIGTSIIYSLHSHSFRTVVPIVKEVFEYLTYQKKGQKNNLEKICNSIGRCIDDETLKGDPAKSKIQFDARQEVSEYHKRFLIFSQRLKIALDKDFSGTK